MITLTLPGTDLEIAVDYTYIPAQRQTLEQEGIGECVEIETVVVSAWENGYCKDRDITELCENYVNKKTGVSLKEELETLILKEGKEI